MAKIVIGVPVAKDCMVDIRTAGYCAMEAKQPGVEWGYASTRDAGIGRDSIAYFALKDPDVTHVYLVDYDVVPPAGALQRLLSHDVPIAAGIYPMAIEGAESAWSFKTEDYWWPVTKRLPETPIEANMIGGSTLLIKREVFEKIDRPWWKMEYHPINDLGGYLRWGEDEYFSMLVRMAGYKITVDLTVICDHFNYKSLLTLTTGYMMAYQSLLGEH
jgi:hypothetical protein